jgi:hypothetical protein
MDAVLPARTPSLPVRMEVGDPGTQPGFFSRHELLYHLRCLRGRDRLVGQAAQLGLEHLHFLLE